ncbi:MAG: 16S rRNA (cytidine(1402)-2'-O)-methyltransferase [SAR202 cluster bacterium]|nr:16S rRNA (cytidine(1402)-2'-O)-methyltransferase [SAR202 cluster bacterium]
MGGVKTLYVVATPIGNLEDISQRAVRVLGEVGLIAAEDARVTRKLLGRYGLTTRLTSYREANKRAKQGELLAELAESDVALVCDAGTPGISDAGAELVRAAAEAGAAVVAIPGASAVTTAIAASGIAAGGGYVFLGFLPRQPGERRRLLAGVASERRALVCFETPQRVAAALRDIQDALSDRGIAVCRELTKLHEEVFRGRVSEAIAHFAEPRGEFTLVIEGATDAAAADRPSEEAVARRLAELRAGGASAKDAVAAVSAEFGVPRRKAYEMWLESAAASR